MELVFSWVLWVPVVKNLICCHTIRHLVTGQLLQLAHIGPTVLDMRDWLRILSTSGELKPGAEAVLSSLKYASFSCRNKKHGSWETISSATWHSSKCFFSNCNLKDFDWTRVKYESVEKMKCCPLMTFHGGVNANVAAGKLNLSPCAPGLFWGPCFSGGSSQVTLFSTNGADRAMQSVTHWRKITALHKKQPLNKLPPRRTKADQRFDRRSHLKIPF